MTNSRAKGVNGELEAVHLFKRWFPDARRGARQSGGGSEGADVIGVPFWVEVKRHNDVTALVWAEAWKQANRDMALACEREIIDDLMDVIVLARSDGDRNSWQVLCEQGYLQAMQYTGPGGKFTHKKLVDGEQLYLVAWSDFAAMLDKHYSQQQELVK